MNILMRSYDTGFQDFHGIEKVSDFVSEDAAIAAATTLLEMMWQPSDLMEIQLYNKGLAMGEWVMFVVVHYVGDDNFTDTEIEFEECYS